MRTSYTIERIILIAIVCGLLALISKAVFGEQRADINANAYWLGTDANCAITPLDHRLELSYGEVCPSTLYDATTHTVYTCSNDHSFYCGSSADHSGRAVVCSGQCVPCGHPTNCMPIKGVKP